MQVGITELRAGLSGHLETVNRGHSITVTDHGRPIARLVPVGTPTALQRLIDEGLATLAPNPTGDLPPLIQGKGIVSDLIAEQRR